jgi:hypothetical protein
MISTIKRFSLLITACASALVLSACETPSGTSATTTMPTLEHLALGMELKFPVCATEVQGENTNIAPIEGQVCQFPLQEGQVADYKVQNHVILLSEGVNEGLSAQVNMSADTIDNKIIQFIILTPGLNAQEQIFSHLVNKLGEPTDAKLIAEEIPESPIATNSLVAIWAVEGGRVLYIGGLKGQNVGRISVESNLVLELQQQAMQQQQMQQQP